MKKKNLLEVNELIFTLFQQWKIVFSNLFNKKRFVVLYERDFKAQKVIECLLKLYWELPELAISVAYYIPLSNDCGRHIFLFYRIGIIEARMIYCARCQKPKLNSCNKYHVRYTLTMVLLKTLESNVRRHHFLIVSWSIVSINTEVRERK